MDKEEVGKETQRRKMETEKKTNDNMMRRGKRERKAIMKEKTRRHYTRGRRIRRW